jgi:hypothetical protein
LNSQFSLQAGHLSGGDAAWMVLPQLPHFQKGSRFFAWPVFACPLIVSPFCERIDTTPVGERLKYTKKRKIPP